MRTYGCLRLLGGLDWIGEFIEIPRLAARQPSLMKWNRSYLYYQPRFDTVVIVKCFIY